MFLDVGESTFRASILTFRDLSPGSRKWWEKNIKHRKFKVPAESLYLIFIYLRSSYSLKYEKKPKY